MIFFTINRELGVSALMCYLEIFIISLSALNFVLNLCFYVWRGNFAITLFLKAFINKCD
ncbi:unnamed protein product [Heterotrigona itama]|uniref:Uncharacterized protein n=1 Tax=Heterotrigona itama TaxID=395501 RepID=A0A6V7GZY4_9HYME|nr:unnamed protein product [Heterotrigona itama]